ncbi:DoxX family membrane protein [Chryseobacterium fluminis]|uniref:DoxX family membrane protein n=1 Tax=Chryseobacterium fluminis TaxID=2983606 RepID=UPI00224E09A7|nr:DoxX family membrane protein [Chryseobacterium sp. MMS21-Ot14]UZT98052.1 DoxX family membrane protein [Chryseobacterium sp. MMS21-Ot14]
MRIITTKSKAYFILSIRILLAYIFISYGFSKMINNQFSISESELSTPIRDLSLFKIAWHLFNHQPFKYFIGVSQIICGLLLIFNRTIILGAFLFLPIAVNILIIDLTIMPPFMARGFAFRLSFYIILDCIILYSFKERIIIIWKSMTDKAKVNYKFSIWQYLLLPVSVIILEIMGALPQIIVNIIINPSYIQETFSLIENLKEIFN